MIEKPIERLNFVNGERLKAADLKLEQEYHMRVQRWLNKSLYSAGIAHGLEVKAEPGRKDDKGRLVILVSAGLALDIEGREMILVEEAEVPIMGKPNKVGEPVQGNYLYIQYHEEKRSEESENCAPRGNGKSQLAWGGPTRVRATPLLGWSDYFPHESSGKVVLAQVELDDKDCSVRFVHTYPRRYIGPASNAMVRQYALEGERHIDKNNPGRIYFHIRGRQPTAVTLYLRAEQFSTLYYTEMGWHEHSKTLSGNTGTLAASAVDNHTHAPGPTMKTQFDAAQDGSHSTHGVSAQISARMDPNPPSLSIGEAIAAFFTAGVSLAFSAVKGIIDALKPTPSYPPAGTEDADGNLVPQTPFFALRVITRDGTGSPPVSSFVDLKTNVGIVVNGGNHQHTIVGKTGNPLDPAAALHTHPLNTSLTIDKAGVSDKAARNDSPVQSQKALTFVDALQIYIGKAGLEGTHPEPGPDDKFTEEILAQLKSAQPAIYQNSLKLGEGRGDNTDPLYQHGTGAIRLDLLSPKLSFPEGEYYIDLAVATGGGRIVYNLYVE